MFLGVNFRVFFGSWPSWHLELALSLYLRVMRRGRKNMWKNIKYFFTYFAIFRQNEIFCQKSHIFQIFRNVFQYFFNIMALFQYFDNFSNIYNFFSRDATSNYEIIFWKIQWKILVPWKYFSKIAGLNQWITDKILLKLCYFV